MHRLRTGEKQARRISLVVRHFALSLGRVETLGDDLEQGSSQRRVAPNLRQLFLAMLRGARSPRLLPTDWHSEL
jgi:hypothetical protein